MMTEFKDIVCLANSRKYNGRCVAGKEIKSSGFGKWVRPISAAENGELSLQNIAYKNKNMQIPQLLDIIKIPVKGYSAHGYQTENYLTDETAFWEYKGKIDIDRVPDLCDSVDMLWLNDFHSSYGYNDRVPLAMAENRVHSSLLLIRPTKLSLAIGPEYHSRKVRANFTFRGAPYRLAVTDPFVESIYRQKKDGDYRINKHNIFLCVSLGEPFSGFTYKLVAAIINLTSESG